MFVGVTDGRLGVRRGPRTGTSRQRRMCFGPYLEPTNGGFTGPIVSRTCRRRKELRHAPAPQEPVHVLIAKGGTIIVLEHQRRSVDGKQTGQLRDCLRCGGGIERQPGQLLAAAQVAHRQHIALQSIDR